MNLALYSGCPTSLLTFEADDALLTGGWKRTGIGWVPMLYRKPRPPALARLRPGPCGSHPTGSYSAKFQELCQPVISPWGVFPNATAISKCCSSEALAQHCLGRRVHKWETRISSPQRACLHTQWPGPDLSSL